MSDLIIINANILTMDKQNSIVGSLSVEEGIISRIWFQKSPPKEEIEFEDKTEIIDLEGRTLVPGFIDTHNHILRYSLFKNQINCTSPSNKSIKDILKLIRDQIKKTKNGEWIEGYGYDDTLLKEQRHPTRYELDQVSPDHPVYINHISGHIAVVNSKALEKAAIDENVTDLQGGYYGRDDKNNLNGILYELPVIDSVKKVVAKPTKEEMIKQLGEGALDYLAQGITSNTDAAVGMDWGEVELEAHLEAGLKGINPLKSQLMVIHTLLEATNKYGNYTAQEIDEMFSKKSNGTVRLNSAKLFQDGSIQGYTGALRKPYYKNKEKNGELHHLQDDLNEKFLGLHKRGFRIAIHGNGDAAIESILDGYENTLTLAPRHNHRHRIEHVQTANLHDLKRMRKLGIAGSFFINHVYYWGDRHKRIFLGPERANNINPLADVIDQELLFTLHSDCPITPISPLFSIWSAVNRKTREGEVLGIEQRIDVIEALKSMTIYGAALNFQEDEIGSIEIGKKADFAVLDEDPITISPELIKDIKVMTTFIDGKVVYTQT